MELTFLGQSFPFWFYKQTLRFCWLVQEASDEDNLRKNLRRLQYPATFCPSICERRREYLSFSSLVMKLSTTCYDCWICLLCSWRNMVSTAWITPTKEVYRNPCLWQSRDRDVLGLQFQVFKFPLKQIMTP